MMDNFEAGRRRFLQGAGISGTALLAGCTEQLGLDDDADGEGGVGIVANIDQQELQALQMEIQEDVQQEIEDGELDEEEAQAEIQQRVQERLIENEVEEMIAALESEGIEVVEEFPTFGAVRATGEADGLLGALEIENVQALVSASDLEAPEEEPVPEDE